jgi:tetratricopeptide (TPR) repeat protein
LGKLVNAMKMVSSELNSVNSKTKPKEKISYEDFLAWCDEDTWAEWVDGEIIILPDEFDELDEFIFETEGKTRGDIKNPFDYRSYSYRLIGHIHVCKEEYADAATALQSAVELSPTYYEAVYDLAQYSAQVQDKETCLSMLRSVIDADIFYFYLAQKERNFEPLSLEVENLLREINTDASDRAKKEISKAKEMIRVAEESIAETREVLTRCRTREELLSSSVSALNGAKSRVGPAEDKVALKDYRASLDAISAGRTAYDLARGAKREADGIPEYYRDERSKRLRAALKPIAGYFLISLLTAIGLSYCGGCTGSIISETTSGDQKAGAVIGFILGAGLGLILGIGLIVPELRDINNVKR